MNEEEFEKEIKKLSQREKDILESGISYDAAQILLRVWPNSQLLKDLVDHKRY